jgi:hypothetical protein
LSEFANWEPIGIGGTDSYFDGNFDGDGKVIQNLTINRPTDNNIGLFGATISANIKNLGLENCNIVGQNYVGGLLGWAYYGESTISNCYVTGSVRGGDNVGGLVGINGASTISNCYTTCKVRGNKNIGGLVGYHEYHSVIKNCVVANDSVIATTNYINRVAGCFYSGSYNIIQNNYALNTMVVKDENGDVNITDGLNTIAGVGKSKTDLQSLAFYTNAANWNTNAWSIDSATAIWKVCDGEGLPFLRWQGIICDNEPVVYTITATASTNGSIVPYGAITVEEGKNQTFTFTANGGYEIDVVKIDGTNNATAVTAGSYTFENVMANHSISVSFKETVGIVEKISDVGLQIYPNPAFTQLHVKFDSQEPANYNIYSIIGQIILQGKVQDNSSINIESLAKGMYYLKIADKTVKFVKE